MDEPYPGWTDTLAAGGGMSFSVAMGYMHQFQGSPKSIMDAIPADLSANLIIAASIMTGLEKGPCLKILHSTTGHNNPITVENFVKGIIRYTDYHPFHR